MGENRDITTHQPSHLGQRRQVTVLFADMVDYTAIVSELGEEKSLDFIRMVYETLTRTVEAHGGTVRDFAGDSIMALFGIPEALEDPALRACRAALAIHAAFAETADEIDARFGVRPQVRIGISSGTVLMAAVQGEGSPATAVGSTVNLASRIESLAQAGSTLICDTTRRLVEWVTDLRFFGEHQIKGLTKPHKLWQLQSIRNAATRFDASLARGLSSYVGRVPELRLMSDTLHQPQDLSVIDLVAEPGLGKTRLVFEFLQRVTPEDADVLSGYCFADRQQVPFLPFLEIVRAAFRIREDDDPAEISRKLGKGLHGAGLGSVENLGLLHNLLGLAPPDGALDGMDGVLIGLHTRELLPALLKAKCSQDKVILLIEDAHWLDRASEDLLRSIIESGEHANLLIIQTRRPEYVPAWLDAPCVTTIALNPLGPDDIAYLAQTRLGVDTLPDALLNQLTERAGGNPLFGEEILSFLLDQGALRVDAGQVVFDAENAGRELPVSMQGLLASRLERLLPEDRRILQAAAVIGRRFDPGLLSHLVEDADQTGAALDRLQSQDVIYREPNASDYLFKHVLLRDSVYQSLVSSQREKLHLDIAETLENRNANRLQEAAETLAYHYGHTDRTDKAFAYNAMAGERSLSIYSLDEANRYFETALDLYQGAPGCATNTQFAAFLSNYALCSNLSLRVLKLIALADTVRPILDEVGDSRHHALYLHHYVSCLVCNGKYREANRVQTRLTQMAERLGDPEALAYAMINELSVSIYYSPITNEAFEAKKRKIEAALSKIDDAYIQNFYHATVGWNELTRGRVANAHKASDRMIAIGTTNNDARSLGYGTAMKALIAMVTDDHELALKMAQEAQRASRVEFELAIAEAARVGSLVPLGKPGALETVKRHVHSCDAKGWTLFTIGPETMLGVAYAMNGQIAEGLQQIRNVIERRDAEGTQVSADWGRLFLCEMHLAILSGEGGGSVAVLLRNFRSILRIMISGEKELVAMLEQVRENPQFDSDGHYNARCDMIMGLLCKARKRNGQAVEYLTKARTVVEMAGQSPMLARIDSALSELR